ncbi:MAG: BMP family lipoprotein [Cellulosilyticaceae bacterium]
MKRRFMALALCGIMATFSLAGCAQSGNSDFKVGMVTDSGTIDDKSFNQGTWEGILRAGEELKVDTHYLKPAGETEADYLKEIQNHYDTGRKFIVTPGFKFETAIFKAQEKYPDAKFVLIDGKPCEITKDKDGKDVTTYKIGPNSVAIFYAEHEAGFLAGVATALELKEGELGFIGGMEIPPVQKFNWGFQQGVTYANENLGTKMTLKEENVVYQGTFYETAAGTQLAASMYDKGVDAIFCAAGGVGAGAIKEATERAAKGENVWIVGVDVDQYADGLYDSNNDKTINQDDASVILTSAMKRLGNSAFDMIQAELDGKFPGGQELMFDSQNDGVGIPTENPNLNDDNEKTVSDIQAKIKSGEITVLSNNDAGTLFK